MISTDFADNAITDCRRSRMYVGFSCSRLQSLGSFFIWDLLLTIGNENVCYLCGFRSTSIVSSSFGLKVNPILMVSWEVVSEGVSLYSSSSSMRFMYSYLVHPVANNAKKTAIIALWHDKSRLFVEVWKTEVNPEITELPPEMAGCQMVTLLHSFLFPCCWLCSRGAETWVDSCFYCSNGCRRAYFSLSMQSNAPTKVRIFFGISSFFPSFSR